MTRNEIKRTTMDTMHEYILANDQVVENNLPWEVANQYVLHQAHSQNQEVRFARCTGVCKRRSRRDKQPPELAPLGD